MVDTEGQKVLFTGSIFPVIDSIFSGIVVINKGTVLLEGCRRLDPFNENTKFPFLTFRQPMFPSSEERLWTALMVSVCLCREECTVLIAQLHLHQ